MKHFNNFSQIRGPQAIQLAATRAVAQLMQIISVYSNSPSRHYDFSQSQPTCLVKCLDGCLKQKNRSVTRLIHKNIYI